MALYEKTWFINSVTWLNENWPWWKKYIWGHSVNMEDFYRNPAEVLRDNCFPFVVKDVNPYSILMLRLGYIEYDKTIVPEYEEILKSISEATYINGKNTFWNVTEKLGNRRISFRIGKWKLFDLGLLNKWYTKYPNALFMFQFALSFKYYVIPIPYVSMNIRYSKTKYFQFGFGWGAQIRNYDGHHPDAGNTMDAVLSAKFRFADYMKELEWNPGAEVYGFYEGNI